jgi:copper(I)-binding protein
VTPWTRRLLVGAIAILVPALAGCEAGYDAPTLQFHQASDGVSTTVDGINLDNVFVLGSAPGTTLPAGGQAGVFLSLYAQNSDQLTSISAPGYASSVQLVSGPVTLNPNSLVDLSGPSPQIVLNGLTNPLSGGQTVQLDLTFANAGQVTLTVPVEPASSFFSTYSAPPTPSPSPSASTAAIVRHKHKHKAKASADPSTTP